MQKYTFPDIYQEKIETLLGEFDCSLSQPKTIAESILKLSTHYQDTRSTPWNTPEFVIAYAAYFFPLNYVRNLRLWQEAKNIKFPLEFSQILDFGCGLGSGYLAGLDTGFLNATLPFYAIDNMSRPLELLKKYFLTHKEFKTSLPADYKNTLGIFSYSLNELKTVPPWLFELDHLLIAEPSTSAIARGLMSFRTTLREKGYFLWAPCTHQGDCPLLLQSKTDWCHDRIHWDQPEWFQKIEQHLPIKNQTLTTSYILASKVKPTENYFGRIIGDELPEKGKTRWMFCRGEQREFLSHLARFGEAPKWKRGQLFRDEIPHEQRSNELRLKE